ncbi:hypothetical protein L6164_029717 [Bauhinia variegata]|uniref:Uncharacterized protein n=1 Tax=Bauhinia variegata TaxID=167791 RepID=A0ACB9LAY4_BAUVA|nr:hypothetical protein L6164_029717 [Bauhinia variegata]
MALVLLLLLLLLCFVLTLPTNFSLNQEGLSLYQFKLSVQDPHSVLSSWSLHNHPCNWTGIKCDPQKISVHSLNLSNANIAGLFPSSILCRLANLTSIDLSQNSICGTLSSEISLCQNLLHLDLSQNLLTGPLPLNLSQIPNLRYLNLTANNFSGQIPPTFGHFQKLEKLSLKNNLLSGKIPTFLANITTLNALILSINPFLPGPIPPAFGNLTNLETLQLTQCNLIGKLPNSLGKLKKLEKLIMMHNNLNGSIPSFVTKLTRVRWLWLSNNSFSGKLPHGMSNITALRELHVSKNNLTGTVPDELCRLPLESIKLPENDFEGELPQCIANSPNLYELSLFRNRFTGNLPKNLGKFSPLRRVIIGVNEFQGEIPATLCDHGELEELSASRNSFSGEIPATLGTCQSLRVVRLGFNRLYGDVPAGIWGHPHVSVLELQENSFSGSISRTIAGAGKLSELILWNNKFTGTIPDEIGRLRNLVKFNGSNNKLSGSLPNSILNLGQLAWLDLHSNNLSGELPKGIQSLQKLSSLNLAHNELRGQIPDEIGSLSVLNFLDLSYNQLSGKIPTGLQNLKLHELNLSYNQLSGQLPLQLAKDIYSTSFLGNPGLCGDLRSLRYCRDKTSSKHIWLIGAISVFAILFVLTSVMLFLKYRKKNPTKWTLTPFHKLGFNASEILEGLDEDNVIGSGSSGKVYKVELTNGETVAVKRLIRNEVKKEIESGEVENGDEVLQDSAFDAEVETLSKIRHKNIVRLWCCCTSSDCKLLVYEYMPNGSLGDLLHSRNSRAEVLDWPKRYKIVVGVAEALAYLHHDCVPPFIHRDVKSNNILLDVDFVAKLADFGVAKIFEGTKSVSVVAGSLGYIAPEYAYTLRVNEKSDIYSFGIVILELLTGKRPVDHENEGENLVKWACKTLDQKGEDHVLDPNLDYSCFKQEICKVLNIGLRCTDSLPINRPSMATVVKMLQEIKHKFISPESNLN